MCESDLSNQVVHDKLKHFVHNVYNVSQPANYWQQIQNIGLEKWDYTFFFVQVIFYTVLTISKIRDSDCSSIHISILGFGSFGEQFFFFAGLLITIANFIRLFVP
eukprot:UN02434